MTQFSWHWGCDGTGDGGADSMTVDTMETIQRLLDNLTPTSSGVVWWKDTTILPFTGFVNSSDGLLEPTNPSGNTVRIASGIGLAQGWLYANDDNVDFDVSSGPTTSTNFIVLRRSRAAQTVRLAYVVAAAPAGTAVITQDSTTWEVKIAEVLLDGSSNISTLTDVRERVETPGTSRILIETLTAGGAESILTSSQIPPLFTDLEIIVRAQASGAADLQLRMNGTAGTSYNEQFIEVSAGAVAAVNNQSQGFIQIGYAVNSGTAILAFTFDLATARIYDYATLAANAADATICTMQGATMGDGGGGAGGPAQLNGHGYFFPGTGVNIDTISILVSAGLYTAGSTVEIWGIN